MCTLTYIPHQKGYYFTSNRDESIDRNAVSEPIVKEINGTQLHFPQDSVAGGTWYALAENGFSVCLLNGAFEKHERTPPYRLSRGLMLLEFFNHPHAIDFYNKYSFEGIEPFTLVIVDDTNSDLHEIRWDGKEKYLKEMDFRMPHIWSSATLYSKEKRAARASWFEEALKHERFDSQNAVIGFHRFTGSGDKKNDLVMERGDLLKTLSITSGDKFGSHKTMKHWNLIADQMTEQIIYEKAKTHK